jgi:hypothetical protein
VIADEVERSATLSPCRMYRYDLWRRWGLVVQVLSPNAA